MTEQEKALKKAKKAFGTSAFTEHHINYCRVGFRRGGKVISAIGDTWAECIENVTMKYLDEVDKTLDKTLDKILKA